VKLLLDENLSQRFVFACARAFDDPAMGVVVIE
jgi:hypothetical protein